MSFLVVKSLFSGFFLGFLYFYLFWKSHKQKNLENMELVNKSQILNVPLGFYIKHILFSFLRILFLFSLLVFFVSKLQIDITICGIGILIAFGVSLFISLRKKL